MKNRGLTSAIACVSGIAVCLVPLFYGTCSGEDALPQASNEELLEIYDARRAEHFKSLATEKAAAAEKEGRIAVPGAEGWLFLASELRMLGLQKPFWGETAAEVSRAARPEWADPLPAIVDFKEQLEKAGVELIVVPVPPKAMIYGDKFMAAAQPGNAERVNCAKIGDVRTFLVMLNEKGVKTIDLESGMFAARADEAKSGPVYCQTDSHWSPRGCQVAARAIAAEIKDRPWLKDVPREDFPTAAKTIEFTGDLAKAAAGEKEAAQKEKLPMREVGRWGEGEDKAWEPIKPDPKSPVLLLGDSHLLVFHAGDDMHATGAGLPDQLAAELGFAMDVEAVRGSGATPARINLMRRAKADPEYLKGKKAVIWVFAAREFTESSGWRKVPVVPE